jgi:hypothetical protein
MARADVVVFPFAHDQARQTPVVVVARVAAAA